MWMNGLDANVVLVPFLDGDGVSRFHALWLWRARDPAECCRLSSEIMLVSDFGGSYGRIIRS
jgi:hypothetical protein